jgi:two-component system chemotaxis sensor kinase CheA
MDAVSMDAEELKVFLQEADEQLQLLDEDIIRLEKEADNTDLLQGIFRAAHTLKGSSAMLGFQKMADLTHVMEDALDKLRSGALAVSPELVDALLASLDALKLMKEALASGSEDDLDIGPLVTALRRVAETESAASPLSETDVSLEGAVAADPSAKERLQLARADGLNLHAARITFEEASSWTSVRSLQVLNELSGLGEIICSVPSQDQIEQENAGHLLQLLLSTGEGADTVHAVAASVDDVKLVEVLPWPVTSETGARSGPLADERDVDGTPGEGDASRRVIDLGPEARGKAPREQLEMAAQKLETMQTVRIDVDRLDALMNLVGELVIDRTRVAQISKALQSRQTEDELVEALTETCTHIEKVVADLHNGMMQARMLPIGTLFNKFPRLVRDLARSMDKSVDLVIDGGDAEIDRSVIEKIKDPLVHLLRNAVDHGIEDSGTRQAAGKPVPALVTLSARHEQGHIVIVLEDDGKGIDPQVIKASAVRKGIITDEAAKRLSDAEAIDLIFEAGMSTAERTTEVSGRGVGMDVVKRSVGAVNGLIKIDSSVGKGTTFTLRLPLTLATFRGLLVESRGATYAIPLSYVQETGRLGADSIEKIVDLEVVNLRGDIHPLLRLGSICQTSGNGRKERDGFMVVVKAGDRPVAVAVDALLEQQEVVVKSFGDYIGQTEGVAGASIMGDGQVVLILDMASFLKGAMQKSRGVAELERSLS